MADEIAKRREIRQRKILENAEARLKKITGRPTAELSSEAHGSRKRTSGLRGSDSIGSLSAEDESLTVNITRNAFENQESGHAGFSVSHGSQSAESFQTDFFTGLPQRNVDTASNGISHRANMSDSYSFPKKVSDAETRSFGRTRADSRRNSSCKQIMMETLQFSSLKCNLLRSWIAMVVGICTKLLFVLYQPLPFHSLFLPYILLELSLYVWMRLETQGSVRSTPQSLLLGVLLLCGVSSHVISILNNILNTMHYIIQDFSVYLFSFVLSHFLYETRVV